MSQNVGFLVRSFVVSRREGEVWFEAGETGVGGLEGMKNEGMEATVEIMAT